MSKNIEKLALELLQDSRRFLVVLGLDTVTAERIASDTVRKFRVRNMRRRVRGKVLLTESSVREACRVRAMREHPAALTSGA